MEIELSLTILFLAALTLLATIDVALSCLSDVGLRRLLAEAEERRSRASTLLKEMLEDRARFRFTLSTAIQVLIVSTTVLITSLVLRFYPHAGFLGIAFVIALALVLSFRQIIPRLIARRGPERIIFLLLPLFQPFRRALGWIPLPANGALSRYRRKEPEVESEAADDEEESDDDDIQALIDVGEEEGIIEEDEGELIHSIIEFGETRVAEVMTPRTEIVALPITATVREARDTIIESKYSRLPVYREQIDNIEGIIYVRDLLQCWAERREEEPIAPLLRPALFVPETKEVADLLKEMQKAHMQLAIVIDEYGGVAGLVTVEDILEEIVGEIEDEDTAQEEIIEIVEGDDGYYEVLGSTEIWKIEQLFDIELESEEFTTVAGMIISELGQVPRPGTKLNLHGLEIEILEADERRIGRVRLRRAANAAAEARQSSAPSHD